MSRSRVFAKLFLGVCAAFCLWLFGSGALAAVPPCDGNTIEINNCLAKDLARTDAQLEHYTKAAVEAIHDGYEKPSFGDYASKEEMEQQLQSSAADWEKYRTAECGAVFNFWALGSIRIAMEIGCRKELAEHRTHEIWVHWLSGVDHEPILPEPSKEP